MGEIDRFRYDAPGWNQWRRENPDLSLDFSKAWLFRAHLSKANLHWADLRKANLGEADLRGADLRSTFLIATNLSRGKARKTVKSYHYVPLFSF